MACRKTSPRIAETGLYVIVYDNVNMMIRVAEQMLGRKGRLHLISFPEHYIEMYLLDAQENGTCATIMPLHNAKLEDMETKILEENMFKARLLELEDIQPTMEESKLLQSALVHTILSIIVNYGGEGFEKWQADVRELRPRSRDIIEVHRTPIHPLPSMEIDESTITGNVEIIEAINTELHVKHKEDEDPKYVQIVAGDQLTIARQRSILNIRIGHENSSDA